MARHESVPRSSGWIPVVATATTDELFVNWGGRVHTSSGPGIYA